MTDYERLIECYLDFAKKLRTKNDAQEGENRPWLECLRVDFWYSGLKQRTGIESAYGLELYFEEDSFKRNSNGTIRHYRSKWSSYEKNLFTPRAATLERVEKLAPGSTYDLNHPLWTLISEFGDKKPIDFRAILRNLNMDIQAILFKVDYIGCSAYSVRAPSNQLLLDKLERRASLDALTALIVLLFEAIKLNQSDFALSAGKSINNVLFIIAIELVPRNVAQQLIDWVIENVLPLGTPPHLLLTMTHNDYVHASLHLNLMVYQDSKRRQQRLTWTHRVKIMNTLLSGRMGLDVCYAMQPSYILAVDEGKISAELVHEFLCSDSLREWAWGSIEGGRIERFPPVDLWAANFSKKR
ncbi:TPA: hypothetical protein ACIR09_005948 [Pseudomonas aeruginosa]